MAVEGPGSSRRGGGRGGGGRRRQPHNAYVVAESLLVIESIHLPQ